MDTKRYEFSEGSSNKFWQIARDGASLRVTFGKIGTAGQAQLKELASEAAAIAEHDKLVKEKTKKGYVLVSQDAAPAGPAPVAKVKTKTPKVEEEKREEAPEAAREAPIAEAPIAEVPAAPPPAKQGDYVLEERYVGEGFTISDGSYAALAAAWFAPGMRAAKEHVASLKAGRSKTLADLRPAVDQVVAFLESEGETTLGVPAGALLLRSGLEPFVVPFLVARFGVAFTVEAYEAAHTLRLEGDGPATSVEEGGHYLLPQSARALVACEARVEPSAWEAALATLRATRNAETSRARRAEYNIVLRDEGFVADDLAQNRANPDWQVTQFVFLATRDPAVRRELAEAVGANLVLEVAGVAGQDWILPKIATHNWLIRTLSDLETVAGARCIANDLTNKRTHEDVREYYAKRPDLALRALVPIITAGGKLAPFVKPVVEATVAAHPALPAIVAPLLDAKSRAYLLAEKRPALPEAKADALPEALRSEPTPGADGFQRSSRRSPTSPSMRSRRRRSGSAGPRRCSLRAPYSASARRSVT
ncbi:MAG: WGR domain-containing protein [Myxococcales bacterium]|nr:WGR domain-containing protein [Myxococcales bacterium]